MRGPSIQHYAAMVAVRHDAGAYLPTRARAAVKAQEAATATMQPVINAVIPPPYAPSYAGTRAQIAWRVGLARYVVLAHIGLALTALVFSVALLASSGAQSAGSLLFAYGLVGLGLDVLAWRQVMRKQTAPAAWLMLLSELLAFGLALGILGAHLEALALLPGAFLLAALLANYWLALTGGAVAFALYALLVALSQTGVAQPLLALPAEAMIWLNLALAGCGMALLCLAVTLATRRLRAAHLAEAAALYRVTSLERRAQTKRVAIDADSIALQTQIAIAMRGGPPQPVTTCEDLAPLANMVNTVTKRIPGLLRDREERIRLERAVQALITALQTAWSGFTFTWPEPSGTSVDRLVDILRPQRPNEREAAS